MQIVEIIQHFSVGQFAVDQVAEVVVVIAHQFFAVDGDGDATSKLEVSRRLKAVSCEDSTIRDINFPSI